MSGFDKLKKLRKLYLTRNKVQVLEGLLENKMLEEVHVDRQLLRPGEHFVMDPRTCQAMASCLKTLNISGSNCHDLAGLDLSHQKSELELSCLSRTDSSASDSDSLGSALISTCC